MEQDKLAKNMVFSAKRLANKRIEKQLKRLEQQKSKDKDITKQKKRDNKMQSRLSFATEDNLDYHQNDSFRDSSGHSRLQMFSFVRASQDIPEPKGSIEKTADALHMLAEEGIKIEENTLKILKDISDNLSNSNHEVTFKQDIFDISTIKEYLPELVVVILVVIILYSYKPKSSLERIALLGIVSSCITVYYSGISKEVLSRVNYLSSVTTPQTDSEVESYGEVALSLFNLFAMSKLKVNLFDANDMLQLGMKFKNANAGFKPLVTAIGYVTAFIWNRVDQFMMKQYPDSYIVTGQEFIDAWLKEVNVVREKHYKQELFANDSSLSDVAKLIIRGREILLRIGGTREVLKFKMLINDHIYKLESIEKSLKATNFRFNGVRQEPVSILLRGPPGCGKSLSMQHIAHAIAAKYFTPEEFEVYKVQPSVFTYNRQAENVFWEGYDANKRIMFIDDLGQARDQSGMPDNEVMNVIRAINVFENQLHCAAIENKGNTTFRSAFVIANTNIEQFKFESIVDNGAFVRRWDFVLDVAPLPQYCVNSEVALWQKRIDMTKLPVIESGGVVTTDLHVSQLEFHLQKLTGTTFVPTGQTLDFNSLMQKVFSKYAAKKIWHKRYLEGLDNTLTSFRIQTNLQMGNPSTSSEPEVIELSNLDSVTEHVLQAFSFEDYSHLVNENSQICWNAVYNFETRQRLLERFAIAINEVRSFLQRPCNEGWVIDIVFEHYLFNGDLDARFIISKYLEKEEQINRTQRIENDAEIVLLQFKQVSELVHNKISTVLSTGYKVVMDMLKRVFAMLPVNILGELRITIPIPTLVSAGTLVGGSVISYQILKAFYSWIAPSSEPESRANNIRLKPVSRAKKTTIMQSVYNGNDSVKTFVYGKARKNVYEVFMPLTKDNIKEGATHRPCGFMFMLRGYTSIMPMHFFSRLQHDRENGLDGTEIVRFTKVCAEDETFDLTVDEMLTAWIYTDELDKLEIGLMLMPRHFRPARDMSNAFLTKAELTRLHQVSAILGIFPTGSDTNIDRFKELMVFQASLAGVHKVNDPEWENFHVSDTWKYSAPTVGGDCGSLLFHNSSRKPAIIGFHIAGIEALKQGISAVLTLETIQMVMKLVEDPYKEDSSEALIEEGILPDKKNMEVAKFQGAYPSSNGKTSIIRSPLFEKWGLSKKKPAKLKPFIKDDVKIDPMEIAQSKYCAADIYIAQNYLEQSVLSFEEKLYSSSSKFDSKEILSFDDAIMGDDSGLFASIPRNTSAGYPYSVMPGLKTKFRFFGTGVDYDLNNEECNKLRDRVHFVIEQAKKGVRVQHYFTDCLKDELRKVDKVDAGQTRMFSACPTPLLVCVRMYFGSFLKWILRNAIVNGIAVGVNEYSDDWQGVVNYLQEFGANQENIGAGDYKGFDMSQIPRIQWHILDMINNWYGDEEGTLVRTILWYEVVNSKHINGPIVSSWASSLGSGFALTWLINAFYNQIAFRLCWTHMRGNCSEFNTAVRLIVCGDDHVYSVHKAFVRDFTERVVQINMANIGLIYQPETKDKLICDDKLRNLTEVSFLKRHFVWDKSLRRYVAPLDLDTILEIPYWVRNLSTIVFDTQTNVMNALEELSLHDRDTFNLYYGKISKAVREDPDLTDVGHYKYDSLREKVLTRGSTFGGYRFVPQMFDLSSKDDIITSSRCSCLTMGTLHKCTCEMFTTHVTTSPIVRIQIRGNENMSGKPLRLLTIGRQRSIKTYRQGAVVADPLNSRNSYKWKLQARSPFAESATETNYNQHDHDATDNAPIGQKPGNFVSERIAAPDPFVAGNTTSAAVDAESVHASMQKPLNLSENLLMSAKTGVTQEVRDFLGKPQIVTSGTLSTTDVVSVSKFFYDIPDDFITKPIWSNKVAGNMAFRATLVLVLQVNGNRFQQGRYIMAWLPDGGAAGNNRQAYLNGHSANLTQVTQLPHVEIDVNCDSQAILEIPCVNHMGWYPVFASAASYTSGRGGRVFLRPYSPLVAPAGSTTASYSLYAYWKDIEFTLPSIPQMSMPRAKTQIKRKKRVEEVEQDALEVGPISGTLSKIAEAAQVMEAVPLISSYAATASWAMNIASRVAAAFGLSKVHNAAPVSIMQRFVLPRMTNSDTPDGSTKLAIFDSNVIDDLPGFAGTDIDELAIGNIATIPAWYKTVSWDTSATQGTLISSNLVSPRNFVVQSTYGANTITFPVPVAFAANFFELWRGGLKLTIKIVKTEFHTGRLLVAFAPSNYLVGYPVTGTSIDNSAYLHRHIVDVRYGNEFSFIVPWASMAQYLPTSNVTNETATGSLTVTVLNPLVAPANVSSSISLLFEISGAPDIEFAGPKNVYDRPVYVTTPQSGSSNTCEIVSTRIGDSKDMNTLDAARMCIGEKVLSFKSLLKRFNPLAAGGGQGTPTSYYTFLPTALVLDQVDASNVLYQNSTVSPDIYSIIGSCFALARGSMRVKIYQPPTDEQGVYASNFLFNSTYTPLANWKYAALPATSTIAGNGMSMQLFDNKISHCEIEFPFYHRYYAWPVADNSVCDTSTLAVVPFSAAPRTLGQYCTTAVPTYINQFRAVGDDFSFGLFVSCPGFETWSNNPS